jgi:hypothetical protein
MRFFPKNKRKIFTITILFKNTTLALASTPQSFTRSEPEPEEEELIGDSWRAIGEV